MPHIFFISISSVSWSKENWPWHFYPRNFACWLVYSGPSFFPPMSVHIVSCWALIAPLLSYRSLPSFRGQCRGVQPNVVHTTCVRQAMSDDRSTKGCRNSRRSASIVSFGQGQAKASKWDFCLEVWNNFVMNVDFFCLQVFAPLNEMESIKHFDLHISRDLI